MLEYVKGNLLRDKAQGLVIPVNTQGVPGAGLARQWAQQYKSQAMTYILACSPRSFRIGDILSIPFSVHHSTTRFFFCFPTKDHWRLPSRIEYIESGLEALAQEVRQQGIESLSLPALGCGLGGLDWNDVKARIEHHLGQLDLRVRVYLPNP
jgi:O-acetyl-ADP-ribose deacetylase (regulator of RNase III)